MFCVTDNETIVTKRDASMIANRLYRAMKNSFVGKSGRLVVGIFLSFVMAFPVSAGPAADQMRDAIEKVVAILKDPSLKSDTKRKERLDQLKQVIYPKFDFAEMANRSLGSHWQRRSPEEQREFVTVFTELLENAYADSIASYDGEKVVITNEKQDSDYAEVNSKIVTKKGEQYAVNYKLHQLGGSWKAYDLVIENISLVNNYRSQYDRAIAKSAYEDLLRNMKDKQFEAPGKKAKS